MLGSSQHLWCFHETPAHKKEAGLLEATEYHCSAGQAIVDAKRFYSETLGCPEVTFRSPYFLEIPLFGKLFVAVQIDGYRGPPPKRARTVVQEPCFGVETSVDNFGAFVARFLSALVARWL